MPTYYGVIYDYMGNFVEIVSYLTEIVDMYIEEADLAEMISYESMADDIYWAVKAEE